MMKLGTLFDSPLPARILATCTPAVFDSIRYFRTKMNGRILNSSPSFI